MKRLLLVLISLLLYTGIYAESVSRSDALRKAQSFMPGKHFVESQSVASARAQSSGKPDAFYVFNADDNGGFVIVSGDDRTMPILGYSDRGQFLTENIPENLRYWLDEYVLQMKYLANSSVVATRGVTETPRKSVNPLIKTEWNQDAPYNTKCPPIYNSYYGQYQYPMTGCVATAMAQVMYYWKCPQTATPAISKYTTESFGLEVPALPSVIFDWDNMKATYDEDETGKSVEAVATLMRYCGQAVEMDYGLGGSAAGIIPYDMVANFGYGKNARQIHRFLYTTVQWEYMIYKEVSEGRPVLYGGSSISGGHEFICDGYENGYFHINWGWGGMSDGFFLLSVANPDDLGIGGGTSTDGYTMEQHAIIGLEPDKGEAERPYVGSYINDKPGWVMNYNRSSASEHFSNVNLPGMIVLDYEFDDEIWPDYELECGWGLYQDDVLKTVLGTSSMTLSKDVYWGQNAPLVSFGGGLADGTYMLSQVYRLKGSEEWMPCDTWTFQISYIVATIAGNTLTLRKAAEEEYSSNIKINSVEYSVSSFEVGRPVEVTVNLINNGDAFLEPVCFWYGKEYTVVFGSVEPGKTGTVQLHFTPNKSGEIPFKISTDAYGSQVVWSETVSVAAAKPQMLSATVTTPGLVGKTLSGTTLKVNLNVKNEGSNIYENVIQLRLYKNTEDPSSPYYGGPLITTKSVMATIQPGETKEVNFTINDLNPDIQYFFFISYSSNGKITEWDIPGVGYPFFPTAAIDIDIDTIVQYIMAGEYEEKADLNHDGKVDAADIVLLVKKAGSK